MAEFEVKNYEGQLYIKEELKKILNSNPLTALANARTVIMFPKGTTMSEVEESLQILLLDVQLRKKFEEEKKKLTANNKN